MPQFYSLQTPGAPTFTAKFASPSSSGRDGFAPLLDPDLMDQEWYHGQDYYPHTSLHSPLAAAEEPFTTVGFSYSSHTVPVSEALAGMSTFPFPHLSSFFPSNAVVAHSNREKSRPSIRCLRAPCIAHRVLHSVIASSR